MRPHFLAWLLFIVALVTISVAITGCAGQKPNVAPIPDEAIARQSLAEFFTLLHAGQYGAASELFGGSYETMIDHNPMVDPTDHASLFRNACTINGAQCLPLAGEPVLLRSATNEFLFSVQFELEAGSVFELGPCCGEDGSNQEPQSVFEYLVMRTEAGDFLVMDLPVYVP